MGLISVPVPGNQFRPPLPETNPNIRKNDVTEKRKKSNTQEEVQASHPQNYHNMPSLPEALPKPKNTTPSVPAREDTPWPIAGKMLGNIFEDRNWLLPKN